VKKRKYTDQQLVEAVHCSSSLRQVLTKLGLVEAGGNYSVVRQRIQQLQIDTSHFKGQGWRKGRCEPVVAAKSLDEIFRRNTNGQSYKLKQRLFAENLKARCCEGCQQSQWMGQPIPLELDHINGEPTDNRIENLRILCPNCHALTDTYRGKKLAKCRDETAPS
jgi:hypothetical protein